MILIVFIFTAIFSQAIITLLVMYNLKSVWILFDMTQCQCHNFACLFNFYSVYAAKKSNDHHHEGPYSEGSIPWVVCELAAGTTCEQLPRSYWLLREVLARLLQSGRWGQPSRSLQDAHSITLQFLH